MWTFCTVYLVQIFLIPYFFDYIEYENIVVLLWFAYLTFDACYNVRGLKHYQLLQRNNILYSDIINYSYK